MGPELRNVSAWPLIKSRVAAKSSGMTGVETILSEILIESMERLTKLLHPFRFIAISDGLWRISYHNFSNLYDFSFNPM